MDSELDFYLTSPDALKQSAFLDETVIRPGDDINGFTAVALLGRGASCEVWRVHDDERKCDVALKLFSGERVSRPFDAGPHGSAPNGQDARSPSPIRQDSHSPMLRARFQSEAQILASIRHPNIIRTYQSGTFRGEPYFTTELLRPLPERMRPRQIIALGLDLCKALECLHSLSIIHRDIKPDNILVAPDGHYVLSDLGIIRIDDASLSQFARGEGKHNPTIVGGNDHALGTPGYAAPEQFTGQTTTPATDIHALGILFDTLFEHHPPFFWKLFIRRLTSTIPAFRYSDVNHVRCVLLSFKYRLIHTLGLFLFILAGLSGLIAELRQPKWIPLPPGCIEKRLMTIDGTKRTFFYPHITLPDNGNYTRGDLIRVPNTWYDFETGKKVHYRSKVVIQGPGRLFVPRIVGAEVHLISNVTLVTSGEPPPNSQFRQHFPNPLPADTNGVSMLLPTFTVAPGSRLIQKP